MSNFLCPICGSYLQTYLNSDDRQACRRLKCREGHFKLEIGNDWEVYFVCGKYFCFHKNSDTDNGEKLTSYINTKRVEWYGGSQVTIE